MVLGSSLGLGSALGVGSALGLGLGLGLDPEGEDTFTKRI